jgi:hypothetical protein
LLKNVNHLKRINTIFKYLSMKNTIKIKRYLLVAVITYTVICNIAGCIEQSKFTPGYQEHPRIIFSSAEQKILEEKLKNQKYLKGLHAQIIHSAKQMLDLNPISYHKTGRRLLSVSRACLKRVLYLSYSYRLTGNDVFLKRAETEMQVAASFKDWNPDHFLDVAEMTLALGIGYDWLHNDLSDKTKEMIESAIKQKGIDPSLNKRYNGWLNSAHNWNQVCNAGLSIGAMAIYDKYPELAEQVIQRAIISTGLPFKEYEPDGAYPEGSMYWTYGTTFHVLFIDAIEKFYQSTSIIQIPDGFLNSGAYYLHVFGPNGSFNYADSRLQSGISPAIYWYASKLSDNSLLYHQKNMLEELLSNDRELNPSGSSDRLLPMALLWMARSGDINIPQPTEKSWSGGGPNSISIHRTSWDNDAIFVGIKGGSPSVNHGHMDVGSFVMDANGIRWAMDPGMHDYYTLEKHGIQMWDKSQNGQRWEIFRYNNFSHNTLVINNKYQSVEGNGLIIAKSETDNDLFTVVDISGVYQDDVKSVIRGISIKDNSYVMIQDEVHNNDKEAHLRWAMMTYDSIQFIDDNSAWIFGHNKKIRFHIFSPELSIIRTYTTQPDIKYEAQNPGTRMIGFEYILEPNESFTAVVLLLPEGADVPSESEITKLKNW